MKQVPVLITWDVDPDRWAEEQLRKRALSMALDLCEEFGVRSTFFITANFAHEYADHIKRMQALRQEIGCHGLSHTDEEDYDRMPEAMQRTYLEEATRKLECATGGPVRVFRSPRVKTSAITLRLLAEQGYLTDSSVCSQRLDLISSNLINVGWLLAPRRPYHPHRTSPFRRGDLPIWEIPISAVGIPFLSKTLNVLGLPMMKMLFRTLYAESIHTGKPIVYLSHPTEFIRTRSQGAGHWVRRLPWLFSPSRIRTHGLLIRNQLLRMDGESLFNCSREFFAYMASFPGVSFVTGSEYVEQFANHIRSDRLTCL